MLTKFQKINALETIFDSEKLTADLVDALHSVYSLTPEEFKKRITDELERASDIYEDRLKRAPRNSRYGDSPWKVEG